MYAKISGKTFKGKQDFHNFRVSPSKYLSTAEGKMVTLQGRNPADTFLTKRSRSTSPKIWYIDIMNSLIFTEKDIMFLCGIFAKDAKMRRIKGIQQNHWPVLLKSVKVMKDKGSLRNCHRLQEKWQLNTIWDTETEKEHKSEIVKFE